jgi:hypothetical protein
LLDIAWKTPLLSDVSDVARMSAHAANDQAAVE